VLDRERHDPSGEHDAAATYESSEARKLGSSKAHSMTMCFSFICTSLDQWFLKARTHVER
jgi:hypothetical protein